MHYLIGKSAPCEHEIRLELRIPDTAPFMGWGVHTSYAAGFLTGQEQRLDVVQRTFGQCPRTALLFEQANAAVEVVDSLLRSAKLVAMFDLGPEVLSIPVGGNSFSEFACAEPFTKTNRDRLGGPTLFFG